ncbi:MAG: tRNA pseudouridine(38-40) synthase TruA [Rugosibacter sp.]|jgi:tRNA pseudouridine38-40 synthase|nr:tRNA pseudouridine(38-40) synthase TruA [Rugosibacter sp.]
MRIALGVEYEGSTFCGWQSQAGGGSVQDALESALSAIADTSLVRVICAGRTDAGVHAIEQVVHFDASVERPLTAWVRGVNAHLPPTIAVRWAQPMPDDFHARFSAQGRRYRYVLLNRAERPGLMARRVGWFHLPLDLSAMQSASLSLLGTHDFSAFRSAECQAKSPIKTLRKISIVRQGDLIVFDFEADGFLHHMVRNLIGVLVYVGKGTRSPDWLAELLAAKNRALAAPTFAACGLYFAGVDYDACWQLKSDAKVGADDTPQSQYPWNTATLLM